MDQLIKILRSHFLMKREYVELIRKYRHQRENWFLVEMIKALTDQKLRCQDQPSFTNVRGKLDLLVEFHGISYYLELKHYVDSDVRQPYPLRTYLGEGNKQYFGRDLRKLGQIKTPINGSPNQPIFLIFYTGKIQETDVRALEAFVKSDYATSLASNRQMQWYQEEVFDSLTLLWLEIL